MNTPLLPPKDLAIWLRRRAEQTERAEAAKKLVALAEEVEQL